MKTSQKRNITLLLVILLDVASVFVSQVVTTYLLGKPINLVSHDFDHWFVFNSLLTVGVYVLLKLYSFVFVSVGVVDAVKTAIACAFITLSNIVLSILDDMISLRMAILFSFLLFNESMLIRFFKRIYSMLVYFAQKRDASKERTIIIGAGDAGSMILKELQTSDKMNKNVIGFIDADPQKQGMVISGVKVIGQNKDIVRICKEQNIRLILIAIPSISKKNYKELLNICMQTNCQVMSLPGLYQLVNGQVTVSSLKSVDVQDLLGREAVKINIAEVIGYIENKIVLVTGGGGSIGSELCRQIATHNPKTLIILDFYENNAYDIEQELKRKSPNTRVITLIASVRDRSKMEDVFKTYRPQIVFNAAAHKHVPLMETSPNEAVKNNVFGTLNVAQMADKYLAETFVQISTDKAVNPTNIMGATKRICEMIIQAIGKNSKNTKFVAVRFGNVLGSNGSVVPLFKKQIEEGGPVTVTHKDIIRYFMTIPEAVSLILQAGAYAKSGQIFVLDMGEPVKIYDLAVNMVKLSGLEPFVDVDIVCTGLRPGEKLFEERLMKEEGLQKTANGLISIANPIDFDEEKLFDKLKSLREKAYLETDEMKDLVAELVPTYKVDRTISKI